MGGITIDMGSDSNSKSVLNSRKILKIQAMYKVRIDQTEQMVTVASKLIESDPKHGY